MAGEVLTTTTFSKPKRSISNRIVCLLNVLSMLCSLPFLCAGIWLATRERTECVRPLMWPVITMGAFIFLFSLLGLVSSWLRINILLRLYVLATLVIIVLLLCITIFAFVVTRSPGAEESLSGRQYQEYRLNKYSKWLRHEVSNQGHWENIQRCIQDAKVCQRLNYTDSSSFFNANLSPLQSGCCKPPTACNFTFVNATDWIATNGSSNPPADCSTWSNDQSELCYECDSCRAGVAETIRRDWHKICLVCAVLFVFLIVIFSLGCLAMRDTKKRYYERVKISSKSNGSDYSEERRSTVKR